MKFSVHSYALKLFFDVSSKTRLKLPLSPHFTYLILVVSSCAFAGNILITSLLGCHHRVISLLRGFVLPATSASPSSMKLLTKQVYTCVVTLGLSQRRTFLPPLLSCLLLLVSSLFSSPLFLSSSPRP